MSARLTPAGEGDARVRVAGDMSLRARVYDVLLFMCRPSFAPQPMAWGRALMLALAAAFAVDLALDRVAAGLTAAWDADAGFLPEPIEQDITLAEDIFASLLLAPVLEELLFRGWLSGKAAALRFALYGFAALGLFIVSLFVPSGYAMTIAIAAVAVVFAGFVHWNHIRHYDITVPAWFIRHFRWLVWGSALVFGLIHLGNHEPLTHPLGLLVVLPQTIGGLVLAYTRTRLGLGAAMAHHAAYNAVFMVSGAGGW